MARPEHTDVRARYSLLSGDYSCSGQRREQVMDSLSLMAFTVANLGKGCRDFVRRKNRGILKICGEEKT